MKLNNKQKRVHQWESAVDAHNAGKVLFYHNNSTTRAQLRCINGKWGFQYTYEEGVLGSIKFLRPTALEAIKAYFQGGSKQRKNYFLVAEDAPPPIDPELFKQSFVMIPPGLAGHLSVFDFDKFDEGVDAYRAEMLKLGSEIVDRANKGEVSHETANLHYQHLNSMSNNMEGVRQVVRTFLNTGKVTFE